MAAAAFVGLEPRVDSEVVAQACRAEASAPWDTNAKGAQLERRNEEEQLRLLQEEVSAAGGSSQLLAGWIVKRERYQRGSINPV